MATNTRASNEVAGVDIVDETVFRKWTPEQKLSRMMSTKTSLSGVRHEEAVDLVELQPFREIGKGQCGVVWTLSTTTETLKVTNPGKSGQLSNDYFKHVLACHAFKTLNERNLHIDINIPKLGALHLPQDADVWDSNIQHLPCSPQERHGFISERIHPLPPPIREALFDTFAPKPMKKAKQTFLTQPENTDCLVRLYLGRRDVERNRFHLRNFDLMVHEMERLNLDTKNFAHIMAQALAVLHWIVQIDANDVEFVLGRRPSEAAPPRASSLGVWLLDFDQCQTFEENAAGLKQLVDGFYFNDPYYPRPASKNVNDQRLWAAFKEQYLTFSARLTESTMPAEFIRAVEERGAQRASSRSLFQ